MIITVICWRADCTCSEGQREPRLPRSSALAACARTGVPTRGHCSLGAVVPARPGQSQRRGGRGTGSVERRGPRGAAPCPFLEHAPDLPGKPIQRGEPGPGAARPTAPAPRGSRADLPAPRHLTVSAPPSIPSRDPAPEGAPPSRPLGPGLAPGPLAGAQARPSCTWAAPARGATPRSAEITFPGAAAAWRAPGHTPPARRPRSRPGRRLLRSPVSRPPASPNLLEERHPAARAGGSGRESFKLATRDELGDPQAAAVPRDDLTSTRRSRAARGAAAPPPSEEPEPQDARGLAAALRAQFRRRFPGRSRALTRSRASPPSLPCVRAAPDPAGDWCSRRRRGAGSPFMPRV
ncbi:hypothetical protein R6Z07M_007958 [Ovis aries]